MKGSRSKSSGLFLLLAVSAIVCSQSAMAQQSSSAATRPLVLEQFEPRQGPGDLHLEVGGMLGAGSVTDAAGDHPTGEGMARFSMEGSPVPSYDGRHLDPSRQRITLQIGATSHNARVRLQYGNTFSIGSGSTQFVLGSDNNLEMTNNLMTGDLVPAGVRFRNAHGHIDLQSLPLNLSIIRDQGATLYGTGLRVAGEVHPTRDLTLYGDVNAALQFDGSRGAGLDCVTRNTLPTDVAFTTALERVRISNGTTSVCRQTSPSLEVDDLAYTVHGRVGARYQITRDFAGYAEVVAEAAGARAIASNLDGSRAADSDVRVANVGAGIGVVYTYDHSAEASRRYAAERDREELLRRERSEGRAAAQAE